MALEALLAVNLVRKYKTVVLYTSFGKYRKKKENPAKMDNATVGPIQNLRNVLSCRTRGKLKHP